MKLKFLGKKSKGCSSCKSSAISRQAVHRLVTPFGIKNFRTGVTYDFDDEEYDFFLEMAYSLDGQLIKYFKTI